MPAATAHVLAGGAWKRRGRPDRSPGATSTPVTPLPSSRRLPQRNLEAGGSGIGWNTGCFYTGNSTNPTAFESFVGHKMDVITWFNTRSSWAGMRFMPNRRAGDIMVYTLPPFPDGGNYTALNNGDYDAEIDAWARAVIAAGLNDNKLVLRMAWEWNVGVHSWTANGVTAAAYKAGFARWANRCRAQGLTAPLWEWCSNKGDQSWAKYPWTDMYPGDDVVDIIGIDPYDHWTKVSTDAGWQGEILGGGTLGKNPGMQQVLDFARARGKQMAISEWGVSHWPTDVGGKDNPFYITKMFEFCKAAGADLAYESYFESIGNPSDLWHRLAGGDPNPNAAARYKQLWPNGWGK